MLIQGWTDAANESQKTKLAQMSTEPHCGAYDASMVWLLMRLLVFSFEFALPRDDDVWRTAIVGVRLEIHLGDHVRCHVLCV